MSDSMVGGNLQVNGDLNIWTSATITSSGIVSANTFRDYNYSGGFALVSNTNKDIVESTVTSAQIQYLNTTSANIQTQLNNLSATAHNHANKSTLDLINQSLNTSAVISATGFRDTNYIGNKVLVSDTNKTLIESSITTTELDYLNNVTSNIQTQFNNKANTSAVGQGRIFYFAVSNEGSGNKYIKLATINLSNDYTYVTGTVNVVCGYQSKKSGSASFFGAVSTSAGFSERTINVDSNIGILPEHFFFVTISAYPNPNIIELWYNIDASFSSCIFSFDNVRVNDTGSSIVIETSPVFVSAPSAGITTPGSNNVIHSTLRGLNISGANKVPYTTTNGTLTASDNFTFDGSLLKTPLISATSITVGNVSNTEFQYLDGVSANIQNQLSALSGTKANSTVTITAGTMLSGGGDLSTNRTVSHQTVGTAGTYSNIVTNSTGHITSARALISADIPTLPATKIGTGIINDTEFNYLLGTSANIQTQILALSGITHTHSNKSTLDLINQSLNTSATVSFSRIDLGKGVNIGSNGNTDWLHIARFAKTDSNTSRKYYVTLMGGDWADNGRIEYAFDSFGSTGSSSAFDIGRINSSWIHSNNEIYSNIEFKTLRSNSTNVYDIYVRGTSVDYFTLAADVKYTNGSNGEFQFYVQTSADVNLPTSATHTELVTIVREQPTRMLNDVLYIRNTNLPRTTNFSYTNTSAVGDFRFEGTSFYPENSYSLGTSTKRWNNVFGLSANIGSISATSITVGSIDNIEFSYLNNVSANIQTQLTNLSGSKLDSNAAAGGDLLGNYPNPTVSKIQGIPTSLVSNGPVYYNGFTIAAQPNVSADSYTDNNFIGSRVLISNNKVVDESSITTGNLSFLSGVSFSISATQLIVDRSRIGRPLFTGEDSKALSARNGNGVNFGRTYQAVDSPNQTDYFAYIQMPEAINSNNQAVIAVSTTNANEMYFGAGSWNASPNWRRLWHSSDFTQTNINNWNTSYTNTHTHSNKSTLDLINQSLNTSANVFFNSVSAIKLDLSAQNGTYDLISPSSYIGQAMATNDQWKIYGEGTADNGIMVFEVSDNGDETFIWATRNPSGARTGILQLDPAGLILPGDLDIDGVVRKLSTATVLELQNTDVKNINVADTIGIQGNSNTNKGYIKFGNPTTGGVFGYSGTVLSANKVIISLEGLQTPGLLAAQAGVYATQEFNAPATWTWDANKHITSLTASYTITLPGEYSDTPFFVTIETPTYPVTLQRSGSEVITLNGGSDVTSIVLTDRKFYTMIRRTGGRWYVTG